jgi:pyruvate/2-oxoglutarate dehydrogenase complex dihydrolipoamide dehydrogenase (E3) component
MPQTEHFDVVILGSGQGGKLLARYLGHSGKKGCRRRAPLGRRLVPRRRLLAVQERTLERAGCPSRSECRAVAETAKTDMRKVRSRKQEIIHVTAP